MKQKKTYEDDDGRVIVNMNVPGMFGYVESKNAPEGKDGEERPAPKHRDADELYGRDFWRFTRSALGAAMLVAGVMIAGMVLFTLFATEVWLK